MGAVINRDRVLFRHSTGAEIGSSARLETRTGDTLATGFGVTRKWFGANRQRSFLTGILIVCATLLTRPIVLQRAEAGDFRGCIAHPRFERKIRRFYALCPKKLRLFSP